MQRDQQMKPKQSRKKEIIKIKTETRNEQSQNGFFGRAKNTDKPLVKPIMKMREKVQTTDTEDGKEDHCVGEVTKKVNFENLDEIKQFLEKYSNIWKR